MKNLSLYLVAYLFTLSCFSQTETPRDSISEKSQPPPVIKIRCGKSYTSSILPLYVIDGIPMDGNDTSFLGEIDPEDIQDITVLKNTDALRLYGRSASNGAVLVTTCHNQDDIISKKEYPFKVYELHSDNENWNTQQDVYNAIASKVPSVRVSNTNFNQTPKISIRGDENTIVIIDGVRYTTSVLNTLNPSDIESIKIAPSAAATNYFLNH